MISSPDGQTIARYVYKAQEDIENTLELFSFDRCEGTVSFKESFQVPASKIITGSADIEWSENGRFLYLANGNEIVQIDFEEENYFTNRDTIAVWDSFTYGIVPVLFGDLHRLPNGKIIVGSFGVTPYLDIINAPNEKGVSCDFVPRRFKGPPDPLNPGWDVSFAGIPTWPPYRMEKVAGGCIVHTQEKEYPSKIKIYPNPSIHEITVEVDSDQQLTYSIFNQLGSLVKSGRISSEERIDVSSLKAGQYILKIEEYTKGVTFIKL